MPASASALDPAPERLIPPRKGHPHGARRPTRGFVVRAERCERRVEDADLLARFAAVDIGFQHGGRDGASREPDPSALGFGSVQCRCGHRSCALNRRHEGQRRARDLVPSAREILSAHGGQRTEVSARRQVRLSAAPRSRARAPRRALAAGARRGAGAVSAIFTSQHSARFGLVACLRSWGSGQLKRSRQCRSHRLR